MSFSPTSALHRILRGPTAPVLSAMFGGSGVLHFVRPQLFESIVPIGCPAPRQLVYASGLAELVCALGLLTRKAWAGPATAAVLVAVWPANMQMAIDSSRHHEAAVRQIAAWARLPLQIPLIMGALRVNRA